MPRRETKRLYYGPPGHETNFYWTVDVDNAKRPVMIEGDIRHLAHGYRGVTMACGLSNVAIDKNNAKAFPHAVHFAYFTKTVAYIVDKLKKDGTPAHAVVYAHSYGHITDRNDDNTLKKLVKENPSLVEKGFVLRVPRQRHYRRPGELPLGVSASKAKNGNRSTIATAKGALARAVKAGRVPRHVAKHLMDATKGML